MCLNKKIFLVPILIFCVNIYSQILSNEAEISILNCGTGNQAYSLYGHTAIRIKDTANDTDIVFNFGTFDFNTPYFLLKFIKGDLQYFGSAAYFSDFLMEYSYEKRTVFEQKIALSQEQKQKLFRRLVYLSRSDERFYTYKFIDRNCTTMVIDKVNEVLGTTVIKNEKTKNQSYREVLYPYMKNHFFEKLGINIIFGAKTDTPADKLFLPLDLIETLKHTRYNGKPLVYAENAVLDETTTASASIFNSIYAVIALLALIILIRKKWIVYSYFAILGLLGVFLCVMGLYSFHEETHWNYNALLFNPLYLVWIYFSVKGKSRQERKIIQILFGFLFVYLIVMLNKVHLGIISPFIIANSILLYTAMQRLKMKEN